MAVAFLTIRLRGQSGRIYSIAGYANDTAANLVKFDESKVPVAGSPDFYTVKEPATLFDIAFSTDLATPTHLQLLRNGAPCGDIISTKVLLSSVVNRANPNVGYAPGDRLQLMQVS